jgi:D-beta-D-heptose 7-phosphate kinase / D-beta-D-heptose 1-phosphate adenosyltransferase
MSGHPVEIPSRLAYLLPQGGFSSATVLVIGDVMLDRYIVGQATRISPEAPVPIVAVSMQRVAAGGAGNVALNLAGLRVKTIIAGVTGDDVTASILKEVLEESGVDTSALVADASRPTTCKTRVMCGSHQLVRFDEENCADLNNHSLHKLRERVIHVLNRNVNAVILSDYAKGVLTIPFTRLVIQECLSRGIPVFVDPKRSDYTSYAGATCLTPNYKEFQSAIRAMSIPDHGVPATGQVLRQKLRSPMLLITQGSDGMTLVTDERTQHFPALAEEVFDVSGAGDTVIATFAAAFASGLDEWSAVELSNIAASVVVRRVGTAPITLQDLMPSKPKATRRAASAQIPS